MKAWLKYTVIALFIVMISIVGLFYFTDLFTFMSAANGKDNNKNTTAELNETKYSDNKAADGFSKYYANIHGDSVQNGVEIINNIAYLPEPKGDLVKMLEAKRYASKPLANTWSKKTKNHAFRQGDRMFLKLKEYANKNNIEVLWWLNRDYVVKDAFRIKKDIIKTAAKVGRAISGHFINGVNVYICRQSRTIVFIEKPIDYIEKQCQKLN